MNILDKVILLLADFRSKRTLSAGTASAASLAALSPGSSARAVPAGVAAFHFNQLENVGNISSIKIENK